MNETKLANITPREGERVAWSRIMRQKIAVGHVEWSFDGTQFFTRTVTWQSSLKRAIQPSVEQVRRVKKLLIKNRNRGGVYAFEANWPGTNNHERN